MKRGIFKSRLFSALICLVMLVGMMPAAAFAEGTELKAPSVLMGGTEYTTLEEAVKAAGNGSSDEPTVITLGEGTYSLYTVDAHIKEDTKNKNLTFVGQGADKTKWMIGAEVPDPEKFGSEYNGDYSFDGAGTITFKDMTLQSGEEKYLGFIRADNTVVENCTINGMTFYWGYTSATFTDTVFTYNGDYPIWENSSNIMSFDRCSFNVNGGRVINVDADNQNGKTVTINFKDCTVNSAAPAKSVLNIHDSLKTCDYVVNFSGNNVVTGLEPNNRTCSRLFQVENTSDSNNGHFAKVTIDGVTVWENGAMVNHEKATDSGKPIYTDGYIDDAYTITPLSDWEEDGDGLELSILVQSVNPQNI